MHLIYVCIVSEPEIKYLLREELKECPAETFGCLTNRLADGVVSKIHEDESNFMARMSEDLLTPEHEPISEGIDRESGRSVSNISTVSIRVATTNPSSDVMSITY
jgi:hypothetical protein